MPCRLLSAAGRKGRCRRLRPGCFAAAVATSPPIRPGPIDRRIQTTADRALATRKRRTGISVMPAISGMTARVGPKNRPMKTLLPPCCWKNLWPCASRSGRFRNSQILAIECLKRRPIRYDAVFPRIAPVTAAANISQKPTTPDETRAPSASNMTVAGTTRLIITSDSANAMQKTAGTAQSACLCVRSTSASTYSWMNGMEAVACAARTHANIAARFGALNRCRRDGGPCRHQIGLSRLVSRMASTAMRTSGWYSAGSP